MNSTTLFRTFVLSAFTLLIACRNGEYDRNEPGYLVPRTVDQDASLPAIFVNGAYFHAEAFGPQDSTLVVVLHGGPGADYRYLLENCKTLANEGYRVAFYDQRGSGLSERFDKDVYDLQIMFDDLTAVIAHYRTSETQKVVLMGHSWGAMLATAYIDRYPDRIDGAILGEPGGFTQDQMLDYLSRSQDYPLTSEALNDAVYLDQFITGRANYHEVLDYKLELWASAEDNDQSPVGNEGPLPNWRAGFVVNDALLTYGRENEFDWTTHLHQFNRPVLFTFSENNTAYGEEHAQRLAAAYPDIEIFKTLDAGHDMWSFPTGWQNFKPVALAYLNGIR